MKRTLLIIAVALSAAAFVSAQSMYSEDLLKRAGFDEAQIKKATTMQTKAAEAQKVDQVDLNLFRAQLEKELLATDPDMAKVEKLLRGSADQRVKMEMGQIRLRVELRKLAGEDRWTRLVQALQARRDQRTRKGK